VRAPITAACNREASRFRTPSLPLTRTYTYDNLNRLTAAVEKAGSTQTFAQNYGYVGNGKVAGRVLGLGLSVILSPGRLVEGDRLRRTVIGMRGERKNGGAGL
jgi:hypothetical protein